MTKTYPAVLRGGQIEWVDETPPWVQSADPIQVVVSESIPAARPREIVSEEDRQRRTEYVRALVGEIRYSSPEEEERARRRVEALEQLAAMGGIQSIPDPVAWQKEQRKDRPLPGRE